MLHTLAPWGLVTNYGEGGGGLQDGRGGGAGEVLPLHKGGPQKVLPCLEGGGGAKSFGPAIIPFVAPHLPIINEQSLGLLLVIIGQLDLGCLCNHPLPSY